MCKTIENAELHHTAAGMDLIEHNDVLYADMEGWLMVLSDTISNAFQLPRDMNEEDLANHILSRPDSQVLAGALTVLATMEDQFAKLSGKVSPIQQAIAELKANQPSIDTQPIASTVPVNKPESPETYGLYL